MGQHQARSVRPSERSGPGRRLGLLALTAFAFLALLPAATAFAGTASTGTLLFYPCTKCHPVTVNAAGQPSHPIPNDFKGHGIVLEGHDVLGTGSAACLVCHDSPAKNPGLLHAVDGTLIDVKTGDIARLCEKCHFQQYTEFKQGIHGKGFASCVVAGCHDPHTPGYINVPALPPFLGTGFQVTLFPTRVPFQPLAGPPLPPAVYTPGWYVWLAVALYSLAAVIAGGLIVRIVRGRRA